MNPDEMTIEQLETVLHDLDSQRIAAIETVKQRARPSGPRMKILRAKAGLADVGSDVSGPA